MKQISKILVVIIYLCVEQVCYGQQVRLQKKTVGIMVQSVNDALLKNYVYPEKAVLITDHLDKQKKTGKYDKITDPVALADRITQDIYSIHNDAHLRIIYDPELEKDIIDFLNSDQEAKKISEKDIQHEKSKNFYFKKLEIFPANIGYLEFTNFPLPCEESRKTIHTVMEFISHTDALIIDMRNNRGGNAQIANEILGYFFSQQTNTGRSFNRISNTWEDNIVTNTPEIHKGLVLSMPLYILTSSQTFSAGEGFTYVLQNQRGATVIGSSTAGGAHLTRSFSLGNGFVGFIPYLRSENKKTNTDWESTGVLPNIEAKVESSLLIAQNSILNSKMITATDDEKGRLKWLMRYNEAQMSNVILDSTRLDQYTGHFAEFEITKQENRIKFRDINQKGSTTFPMIPITTTLFQVGEDYQVEFVDELNQQYMALMVSWSDGWTEKIDRKR